MRLAYKLFEQKSLDSTSLRLATLAAQVAADISGSFSRSRWLGSAANLELATEVLEALLRPTSLLALLLSLQTVLRPAALLLLLLSLAVERVHPLHQVAHHPQHSARLAALSSVPLLLLLVVLLAGLKATRLRASLLLAASPRALLLLRTHLLVQCATLLSATASLWTCTLERERKRQS